MNTHVIITLIMIAAIVILLLKGIGRPGTIFLFVPMAAALLMGFSPRAIQGMIIYGLHQVAGALFLMILGTLYFNLLHEAGVFQALVRVVLRFLGNSIVGTLISTAILSLLTQLDGSGATTALCTIPAMRPIYEKQRIRREVLLLIESVASGIFCLLPWAPGLIEVSSYAGVDFYEVFRFVLPLILFSVLCLMVLCVLIGLREARSGAGLTAEEFAELKKSIERKAEFPCGTATAAFDAVYTLVLMTAMLRNWIPAQFALGFSFPILFYVNLRGNDARREYLSRQAPIAWNLTYTMLGVAVLVGVNHQTGALNELALWIAGAAPTFLMQHLMLILCIVSFPLSVCLGSSKNSAILPAIIPLAEGLGISPIQVVGVIFATGVLSANLNPFNAVPYLALGLADVELKDHLRYSMIPVYLFTLVMTGFIVIYGMIPI